MPRLSPDTVEGEKYRYLSPSTGICILLYNIPVAVLDEAADGDVERGGFTDGVNVQMQAEAPVVVRVCRLVYPLFASVWAAQLRVQCKPVLKREDGQHGRGVQELPEHIADFPRLRIHVALHAERLHVVAGGGADAEVIPFPFSFHAAHFKGEDFLMGHDSGHA